MLNPTLSCRRNSNGCCVIGFVIDNQAYMALFVDGQLVAIAKHEAA